MATNEILPFAQGVGANVQSQVDYAAEPLRSSGNVAGIARSNVNNKALRQASLMASALAQYIADNQSNNVVDTETPTNIAGWLANAITAAPSPYGIASSASNLKASSTGTNAAVTVTADSVCVKNASNQQIVLNSVSITPSFANAGANGLDVGAGGSQTASTWYSVWVIWNGTTTAGLLSLSATSPALPSGYTHKARVGWVRSDSTANKYPLAFVQYGNYVQYRLAAGTNMTALPVAASGVQGTIRTTLVAVAAGAFVPPTAYYIEGRAYNGENGTTQISPNSIASVTAGASVLSSNTTNVQLIGFGFCLESGNIYYAGNVAGASVTVAGWRDSL